MISNLDKPFKKIGAEIKIGDTTRRIASPITMNIINNDGVERFELLFRKGVAREYELSVLEVKAAERHLVLLARRLDSNGTVVAKNHFLCGHDERHLFVANVDSVSTVAAAKASLKPELIRERETGLNSAKRNRRRTREFVRQGEWFFVRAEIAPTNAVVLKNEPLTRGAGSKPHIAQFAYRIGGEAVKVCRQYPNGISFGEYKELIEKNPHARHFNWRDMRRNMSVYVKGRISHPDHATVVLDDWHQVLMNRERRVNAVAFLD